MTRKKISIKKEKETIKELMTYIMRYKSYLILSLVFALFTVVLTLAFPLFTGKAIDALSQETWLTFIHYIFILILIALLNSLFQFLMNLVNNKMTYYISRDIRKVAFIHIQTLPLSYLDSHSQGDLVSRLIQDVDQISDGLLMGFTQLFTGVLTIIGTLGCLFYINWIVALVVLLVTPISLFTASIIAKKTYSLFHQQSEIKGEQTSYIDQMLPSELVIQAFNKEKDVEEKFNSLNESLSDVSLKAIFISSLTNPITRFVNSLVYTGVAFSGGIAALYSKLTVGALSATLTYASQYTKPFNEISGVMTELQNALASSERVFSLISTLSESPDSPKAKEIDALGYVEAEDVWFSYTKDQHLIEGLSFKAKPGMKIAIVGPTGCGKTTIINLLMRFYDVNQGKIKIDDIDERDIKRNSLRRSYGMVLQETWLKRASIWDNLTYANREASKEEVEEVIKKCHLESFISTLPNKLDEIVSDEVENISQGQRQLLCIARVMLSKPKMLILDEATSSIDTRTEQIIQKAFATLMQGRTTFIVAHRLSTIKGADLILVMKDGNIIEKGKHDELLGLGGFYNELYNSQFAK